MISAISTLGFRDLLDHAAFTDLFMTEDQKRSQASAKKKAAQASTRALPAPSRFEGAGEQS
jgi:hypothetical protein